MAIVRLFLEICLLRQGPGDIPYSNFLFYLTFMVYLMFGISVLTLQAGDASLIIQMTLQVFTVFAFVWGCLALYSRQPRFMQTMTAVLGSDALISFIALPLLFWIKVDPGMPVLFMCLLGLMFWQLIVMGHILRRALDKSLWFGVGLTFLFLFMSFQLMGALAPGAS